MKLESSKDLLENDTLLGPQVPHAEGFRIVNLSHLVSIL